MALNKEKMAEVLSILAKMDEKDLTHADDLIKSRLGALKEMQVSRFPINSRVEINYPRGQDNVEGVVTKHNRYTVVVRGNDGQVHRVDPDILTLKAMAMA